MADDREPTEGASTPTEARAQAPGEGAAVEDFFSTDDIFRRVLATAAHELERPTSTFIWGALAAGLIVGFSFLARAVVTAQVQGLPLLVGNLLYPIGFIFVILGRYPLYTENTLTPVTLALTRFASLRDLLRTWGLSYLPNLMGAFVFALLLAGTGVLRPETAEVARGIGEHLLEAGWADAFFRAVLAGWLLAGLVWLVHAARDTVSRLLLIWLVIYLQVSAELYHCIVGSVEVLYLVLVGGASFGAYLSDFLLPVTLGNTLGGVVFVALLNWAQFSADKGHGADLGERLAWREWLWGRRPLGRSDA
jgi:formate-nitrite transporter family protein